LEYDAAEISNTTVSLNVKNSFESFCVAKASKKAKTPKRRTAILSKIFFIILF
jgi:hypothetical protein